MVEHESEPVRKSSFEQWVKQKFNADSSTKVKHIKDSQLFYISSFDHSDREHTYLKEGEIVDFRRNYYLPNTSIPPTFTPASRLRLETEHGQPRMLSFGQTDEDGISEKNITKYRSGHIYYKEINFLPALKPGFAGFFERRILEIEYSRNGLLNSMRFYIKFPSVAFAHSIEYLYDGVTVQEEKSDYFPSKLLGPVSCEVASEEKILFQRSTKKGKVLDKIPIPLTIPAYDFDSLVPEELLTDPATEDTSLDAIWKKTNPSSLVGIRWEMKDKYDRYALYQ